jgi:hypothetical protein
MTRICFTRCGPYPNAVSGSSTLVYNETAVPVRVVTAYFDDKVTDL